MSTQPKSSQPADRSIIPLRLPELGHEGQPGSRFVRRAVGMTLTVVVVLAIAAFVVAFTVRMDVTVKTTGVLEPVRIWPVRAMESGPVREVLVETGDTVRKGALLARLDSLALSSEIAQLEAQYRATQIDERRSASADPLERARLGQRADQAQARLVSARATLRQRMVEYDLGTNVDSLLNVHRAGRHVAVDQAVGEIRSAEAELRLSGSEADLLNLSRFDRAKMGTTLEQLASQIAAARERKSRLVLTSPIDGVVLTEQVERLPGSFVREGDQILEVADLDDWRVELMVPDREVYKIKVGDRVSIEIQAFEQSEREELMGKVEYVSPEPMGAGQGAAAAAGGGGYRVIATLDESEIQRVGIDQFRRGYSVRGNVITRSGLMATLLWDSMVEKFEKVQARNRAQGQEKQTQ
jgi:multidrug resistance efflux pump